MSGREPSWAHGVFIDVPRQTLTKLPLIKLGKSYPPRCRGFDDRCPAIELLS
jgi:hypothetical protein